MKKIIINGNNFNEIIWFYNEVKINLAPSIDGDINLDAFNDILCGGFWIFEYWEEIELTWLSFSKSRLELKEINEILEIIKSNDNIILILK